MKFLEELLCRLNLINLNLINLNLINMTQRPDGNWVLGDAVKLEARRKANDSSTKTNGLMIGLV